MQNKKIVLISVLLILGAFFVSIFFYKQSQTQKSVNLLKEQSSLFQRPYSVVVGNANAKVQLVEFFDPACETCALLHPYIKDMIKKYDGKVKLVLRYAAFHKNSDQAVKMLEGARKQNKFNDVLELMFATQKYWTQHHEVKPKILWNILLKADILDMKKLATFMDEGKHDYVIAQDLSDAKSLNVTKTPGFIVNGMPLQKFGLDNLKQLIQSQINK